MTQGKKETKSGAENNCQVHAKATGGDKQTTRETSQCPPTLETIQASMPNFKGYHNCLNLRGNFATLRKFEYAIKGGYGFSDLIDVVRGRASSGRNLKPYLPDIPLPVSRILKDYS